MKPYVCGKNIVFREVTIEDAEFIVRLRTDPAKKRHLSETSEDVDKQKNFIAKYLESKTDYYFIISDKSMFPVGTIRIYDTRDDSFCWGSWIISNDAPKTAAIESAIMIYDFAYYSLRFKRSHFDVRKANYRVAEFHKRFGATIVGEDDLNFYFEYDRDIYSSVRNKYIRYIP